MSEWIECRVAMPPLHKPVLVCKARGRNGDLHYFIGKRADWGRGVRWVGANAVNWPEPTHWMPLPGEPYGV